MKKEKGEKAAGCPPGRELKIKNYELRIWATDPHRSALIFLNPLLLTLSPATDRHRRDEKGKMKKEKGEGKRPPVAGWRHARENYEFGPLICTDWH